MQALSLILRNLLFTILQPGLVAGFIPYWIIGKTTFYKHLNNFQWQQYTGLTMFAVGFIIMLVCIIDFGWIGKGTLSPADPTRHLVTKGLYRYSRNPMYVGVMLELLGESLMFQSSALLWYSLFVFIAFNVFIVLHEEPRLRQNFPDEYAEYFKKVRKWL